MLFIGYIECETPKAFLFQDHYWAKSDWLPRRQVDVIRFEDTFEVKILASAWICEKKNIEEFEYRSIEEIENGRRK